MFPQLFLDRSWSSEHVEHPQPPIQVISQIRTGAKLNKAFFRDEGRRTSGFFLRPSFVRFIASFLHRHKEHMTVNAHHKPEMVCTGGVDSWAQTSL